MPGKPHEKPDDYDLASLGLSEPHFDPEAILNRGIWPLLKAARRGIDWVEESQVGDSYCDTLHGQIEGVSFNTTLQANKMNCEVHEDGELISEHVLSAVEIIVAEEVIMPEERGKIIDESRRQIAAKRKSLDPRDTEQQTVFTWPEMPDESIEVQKTQAFAFDTDGLWSKETHRIVTGPNIRYTIQTGQQSSDDVELPKIYLSELETLGKGFRIFNAPPEVLDELATIVADPVD